MKKLSRTVLVFFGLILSALMLSATLSAQEFADAPNASYDANGAAVDPPSRVARLAQIQGPVSFAPAGEDEWAEAQINRPLVTGDKLWADRGARAELQIGAAVVRVNEQTSFNILNLDDSTAQIELTQGTLNLRVRRLYDNQTYEIDTPTLAFVINRVGEYRIDVSPIGNGTIVTAFHGGGDAYGEAGARFRIEEGQSVRFNDTQLRDYAANALPEPDNFDRYSFDRDARWDNSPSRQYVSEEVIGYDDLDNNGSWNTEPEYGAVWYPRSVDAGWTPYSSGHWGWVGAYGWTWIDSSPWGFAPFHYGRWAYVRNRWGWCPGPVQVRPYYAPALVAFIGGGGLSMGFSSNRPVGWFPLGPRDVYVPGYRVSRNYFTNINIHNTTINNVTINNYYGNYSRGNFDYNRIGYANRNIAGAVTAVPGNVFVGARPIRGSALAVNRETFANGRLSGFAAIAPTRQSLAFNGGRNIAPPSRAIVNRNVVAATRPPAPIAPFAQREGALQRNPGRALSVNQLRAAPALPGNAGLPSRAGAAVAPNVRVVTNNGIPTRTPAPALTQRNAPNQSGRLDAGRNLPGNPNLRNAPDAPVTRDNAPGRINPNPSAVPNVPAMNRPVAPNAQQQNTPPPQRNVAPEVNSRPSPGQNFPPSRTPMNTPRPALPTNAAPNVPIQRANPGMRESSPRNEQPQEIRSAPVQRAPQQPISRPQPSAPPLQPMSRPQQPTSPQQDRRTLGRPQQEFRAPTTQRPSQPVQRAPQQMQQPQRAQPQIQQQPRNNPPPQQAPRVQAQPPARGSNGERPAPQREDRDGGHR